MLASLSLTGCMFGASAPDFSQFEAGDERKQAFIQYFAPLIASVNHDIERHRSKVIKLQAHSESLGFFERRFIKSLSERYALSDFDARNVEDWESLLARVNVVPASLALAQAANESGWGTSRFAREGNNYFGQWCFSPGCGLVPRNRGSGKTHEVASFSSAIDSVRGYMHNLNTSDSYEKLRAIRARATASDNPVTGTSLAAGLLSYSERGQEYVRDIKSMIRVNDLEKYDLPAKT